MFGGKDKPQGSNEIPILTIDHYPGREYEVIGLVTASEIMTTLNPKLDVVSKAVGPISSAAIKLGADAVIGFRALHTGANWVYGYGTAIKFK